MKKIRLKLKWKDKQKKGKFKWSKEDTITQESFKLNVFLSEKSWNHEFLI